MRLRSPSRDRLADMAAAGVGTRVLAELQGSRWLRAVQRGVSRAKPWRARQRPGPARPGVWNGSRRDVGSLPALPDPPGRPAPLVVFLHGGYWQELSKLDASFAAVGLVGSGVALAAVEYTLAPAATLEGIVEQATRSVRWVHANAAELGVDPTRIVVTGHSAGAHLAAKAAERLPDGTIAGLVLIGGVFDLRPIAHTSINDALGLDEAQAARLSVTPRPGLPPAVIVWGVDETDEFRRQSRELVSAWRAAGDDATGIEVEGRHHFDLPLDLGDAATVLGSATLALARDGRTPG